MPKATASKIPRPKADKPAVVRHDEETIIEIKVLDLKGKTMSDISKATGVPTTSVLRFLNQHKPDPRQSEAARKKQIAQHERLLGIAVMRLADESKGKGKSNASASSSRASTSKSAPLPAAKRVATTGSTSRDSPYANKASSIPTRPTRAAASTSQSAASSSKTAGRESSTQSRSKAIAEKEKEKPTSSGSKSRGSPYAKPAKAESKPASTAEQPSSSRRRSVPVIEVRVTKGPRSSLSKATSTGPFSSKPTSTASPARPLAFGSRGVIVPKSSPAVAAPPAASTHRRTPSTTPLPIPENLVELLPPVVASPKGKGKEKAVSPEAEEDVEDEAQAKAEDEAEVEAEDQVEEEDEVEQEMEPELVESITTEVDLVSQAVVDDALAAAEGPAAAPEVDDTAYPSPPIEVESSDKVPAHDEPSPAAEGDLEDVSMAEPAPDAAEDTLADSIQEDVVVSVDDTLGDLDDDEEGEDLAVSAMLVEETPVMDDAQASTSEEESPFEEEVAPEKQLVSQEEIVVQTTIEEPSEQQPEATDMSPAESTEMTEDYVADIATAMEEAVHNLEAASGVEADVLGSELAQLKASVPELEAEVEQQVKVVVEETVAGLAPILEEEQAKGEEPSTVEGSDEKEVEFTGDLEMDEAEKAQDEKLDATDGATDGDMDLSTAPADESLAQETESPSTEDSTAIEWPVAYLLNIGQEHISVASSLPEPYSKLFGRQIWPVFPTA